MIKISVLTCTYNCSKIISTTLSSVLSQSHDAVEHIIVDGASKDSTVAMAEEYKLKSDWQTVGHEVKILSEHDNGLYYAMNKALEMATGDYVVFLNAGDFFPDENTLYNISKCAESEEALPGVVYGDTDLMDSEGRFLRHRRLTPPRKLTWRSFADGMVVCHQAFYALTSIAKVTPYNIKYKYSADVDWCIRVMKATAKEKRKLINVNRVVVNYLSEGMTTQNHQASLKERFKVMCSHYGIVTTAWKHFWFLLRAVFKK